MFLDGADEGKDGGSTDSGRDTSENSDQTSGGNQQTSTIDPEKVYKGADVQKLVTDALAADGREQKTRADAAEAENTRLTGDLATLNGQVTGLSKQMSDFTDAREAAERDAVKDDPAALASLATRQANAREALRVNAEKAENDRRKTASDAKEAEIDTKSVALDIKLAAIAGGVDEKALAARVPDGNAERLALAVADLKKGAGPVLDADGKVKIGPDGKDIPAALRQKPASAVGTGSDTRGVAEKMLAKAKEDA